MYKNNITVFLKVVKSQIEFNQMNKKSSVSTVLIKIN